MIDTDERFKGSAAVIDGYGMSVGLRDRAVNFGVGERPDLVGEGFRRGQKPRSREVREGT